MCQLSACIPVALMLLIAAPAAALNGFDLTGSLVDRYAIEFGGQPRDGIPAIEAPRFVAAPAAKHVSAHDRVLGLFAFGEAKAYPVKILVQHEVVNDAIGGIPIAVSYCPLCASGIAFVAEAQGQPLTFGVSGLLYNSNLLLYDRETESLWSQLQRRAISGPMAGARLRLIPMTHSRWEDWRREHPGTQVLSAETGFNKSYHADPYEGYAQSQALLFSASPRSDRYPPKEKVLGIRLNGQTKAYPFAELRAAEAQTLLDRFAGRDILIQFDAQTESARAYAVNGTELPATISYWFAWFSFHPETAVFEAP